LDGSAFFLLFVFNEHVSFQVKCSRPTGQIDYHFGQRSRVVPDLVVLIAPWLTDQACRNDFEAHFIQLRKIVLDGFHVGAGVALRQLFWYRPGV
jgi:hypothetical protein